jgi:hypothetical protein
MVYAAWIMAFTINIPLAVTGQGDVYLFENATVNKTK